MNEQGVGTTVTKDDFPEFVKIVKNQFDANVKAGDKLFTVEVPDLYDVYLNNLPEDKRQVNACNTCKYFLRNYGNLVKISETGEVQSVLWNDQTAPSYFTDAVKALKKTVEEASVNGVFYSEMKTLGQPVTGKWTHFSVQLPEVHRNPLKTANQAMAEKREDVQMVERALKEFSQKVVEKALTLIETEALYRSDKVLGVAKWMQKIQINQTKTRSAKTKNAIIWQAVATAPAGFAHIRASMIGTLLEDIAAGLPMERVAKSFAKKMDPANYMRSVAAPTEGGIKQAEKIVSDLGIAPSLDRRYAKYEEIPSFLWEQKEARVVAPSPVEEKTGVFGHITPKGKETATESVTEMPSTIMTWEKFQRTVLPTAEKMEVKVNPSRLMAIITASDETAPNILQWDNRFSWYYPAGVDGEIKRRVESAGGRYVDNEIRVSLIWEGHTDLDLHCETPSREVIYYGAKRGRCGGWLDIDMNGGSHREASPVENIRWSERAPEGRYCFTVKNYKERGTGSTPFKAELEINGKTYAYNGIAGGTGYSKDVFVFDYVKGEQPVMMIGSSTSEDAWSVEADSFVQVNGITTSPNLWGETPVVHAGNHVFFLLEGCKDLSEGKGRGFFNEMLKPELREIRKTLEVYTAGAVIADAEEATACGVGYSKENDWDLTVKVTKNNATRLIKIDRWD